MAGGLTAKQIGWLRERMEPFRELHNKRRAADAHSARVRAKLEKRALRLVTNEGLICGDDEVSE